MIKGMKRLPMWSIVVMCIALLIVVAGILTPHYFNSFFSSTIGSFVSNVIAEFVGILIGALFVFYVVDRYMERSKLFKLIEQRNPFLESLGMGLLFSLNALCQQLKCPLLDAERLKNDIGVTKGKEEAIKEWFQQIKQGEPLEPMDIKKILECLDYILNYSLRWPLDEIRAVSHLFEDDPKIIRDVSGVTHSVHTAILYFRHPNVKTVTCEGQELLGGIGELLVDLLVRSRLAKIEKKSKQTAIVVS